MKTIFTLVTCFAFILGKAQTITNVSPDNEEQGTWSLPITITGSGTYFSNATSTVLQISQGTSQLEVLSINSVSITSVNANIRIPYYSALGDYDVKVYDQNVDSMVTLYDGFTVINASNSVGIIETYPNEVLLNATLPVTISTTQTNFMQATDNIVFLTQGTHTIFPIPGSIMPISNDSIKALFNFNLPFLLVGDLLNSHCGNSFDGILTDYESILIHGTLQTNPVKPKSKLSVFPNPTTGELEIKLPNGLTNFQLNVYNPAGQKVWMQSVKNNTSNTLKTDISNLPKGIYLVKIQEKEKVYTIKVVKK